jgi:uncharacterized membrane protein
VTDATHREHARARRERGAVLPIVAMTLTVLLLSTAFTVDLGRQMLLRRDLQANADAVAFDLARLLDGRTGDQLGAASDTAQVKTRSATANGIAANKLVVAWGTYDEATNTFTPVGGSVATAVQVTATDQIDYYFARVVGFSKGAVTKSAVAAQDKLAIGQVGSHLANLDSAQIALLNNLLKGFGGPAGGFTIAGWNGLASSSFTMGNLAAAMGLGSADALMTSTVNAKQFATAAATLMPPGSAGQVELNNFAQTIPNNQTINMGQYASVGPNSPASAEAVKVDLADVLVGQAFLVNRDDHGDGSFLDIPALSFGAPGVSSTTAHANLIESARVWGGRVGAKKTTQQANLTLNNVLLAGSGITGGSLQVQLVGAQATGTITAIDCAARTITLGATTSSVLSTVTGTITSTLFKITITGVPTTLTPTAGSASFSYPTDFDYEGHPHGPKRVPTAQHKLNLQNTSFHTSITLLNGNPVTPLLQSAANTLLGTVTNTTIPTLLTGLDTSVISKVSPLLGLTYGAADLWAKSIDCVAPLLRK